MNAILGTISEALARRDRVELHGFGIFSVTKHGARMERNPKTDNFVAVSAKGAPAFKAGKDIDRRLNPASPSRGADRVVMEVVEVRGRVDAI